MPQGTGPTGLIRAAGGVVWRDRDRRELAVIYRDIHVPDECCLPKGKLDPGEDWRQAAVREVLEETGCRAVIAGFAGLLHYPVGNSLKAVVYFDMLARDEGLFVPTPEVTRLDWLTPPAALDALVHQGECEMLRQFLGCR